jgi:hypothetical protein
VQRRHPRDATSGYRARCEPRCAPLTGSAAPFFGGGARIARAPRGTCPSRRSSRRIRQPPRCGGDRAPCGWRAL